MQLRLSLLVKSGDWIVTDVIDDVVGGLVDGAQ